MDITKKNAQHKAILPQYKEQVTTQANTGGKSKASAQLWWAVTLMKNHYCLASYCPGASALKTEQQAEKAV